MYVCIIFQRDIQETIKLNTNPDRYFQLSSFIITIMHHNHILHHSKVVAYAIQGRAKSKLSGPKLIGKKTFMYFAIYVV